MDAQDSARKWYEAIVREVSEDTVKVHYFGWGSKWDGKLPRRKGTNSKVCRVCRDGFCCIHVRNSWSCVVLIHM